MPAKETLLTAVQATNFPNYMYEVGVDGFTRKIACSLYPTATNELVDGRTKRTKLHQELHLQVRGERVQSGGALHRDGVDTSSSCLSTRLLTAVQAMARARARAWRRASSPRGASTTGGRCHRVSTRNSPQETSHRKSTQHSGTQLHPIGHSSTQ